MRIFPEKYRLLGWLFLILLAGFVGTSLASYFSSRDYIRHSIADNALPLTSDNIYSEIQKDILRPIFISSLMAHDTFVRDWLIRGEPGQDNIVRYLNEVKQKYGTITSFLISEKTRRYYYAEGLLKNVKEEEPRDAWYFRVRAMQAPYETNVDIDMANHDAVTIFINYRVLDYDGNFLGTTGVGLTLDTMSDRMDRYEKRFNRRIYFTNSQGKIMLSSRTMRLGRRFLHDIPGINVIARDILQRNVTPSQLAYDSENGRVLVNARFIPELGWHLVVEQGEAEELQPVQRVLLINLAAALGVTLLVLMVAWLAVRRYQQKLERMATHDALTGCLNRQAFEIVFKSFIRESLRSRKPLSAILFDIDHFKAINDSEGHLVGDAVLRELAGLVQKRLRSSDVVARWGGEEFMVLLNDCHADKAHELAEALRKAVSGHTFPSAAGVSLSLAVAEYDNGEDGALFFSRLDDALYAAKAGGRNRVEDALSSAQARQSLPT